MNHWMDKFGSQLKDFARLAVRRGVNLQTGQGLLLGSPIEAADLAARIAEEAYQAGAKDVHLLWEDDRINRLRLQYAPFRTLQSIPDWKLNNQNQPVQDDYCVLHIYGPDPDSYEGIAAKRVAAYNGAKGKGLVPFYEWMMNDRIQWSMIAYPTRAWAEKVFPECPAEAAQEKLMEEILRISRIREGADPLSIWDVHNRKLHQAADFLNRQNFKELHYRSEGTDLTVRLPGNHIWSGGSSPAQSGVVFNANIPTEEVYTLPDKRGVNGTVASKMPLNCDGQLIDRFSLTFKEGKVIDFQAEKGEEALRQLLDTDPGSVRLGEVALVPHHSPVSESGVIFFNTLFDENASCHLALGKAYPTCIKEGNTMTADERDCAGVNDSIIHEDFMIGSGDLAIDGIRPDGQEVAVFRNGGWALSFSD